MLFAIAAAPVILIAFWFYYKDKFEKEPLRLLLYAFLAGCISVFPVILIEGGYKKMGFEPNGDEYFLVFYAYIVIAFTEEICKYFFVRRIMNKSYVNEPYDGILYSVMVSLGFAFVENLFYVYQSGLNVGILRAFTAVPAHATFGAIMGYYLGKGKFNGYYGWNTILGIAGAVLFHGSYDYFLFLDNMPLIQLGAFVSLLVGIRLTRSAIYKHNTNSPFRK